MKIAECETKDGKRVFVRANALETTRDGRLSLFTRYKHNNRWLVGGRVRRSQIKRVITVIDTDVEGIQTEEGNP